MNMNKVINSIKLQLGLNMISLPFTDSITGEPTPPEKIIREVIETVTIPQFSQFAPWVREVDAKVRLLNSVDKKKGIYMLPDSITDTEVISILNTDIAHQNNDNDYCNYGPIYGAARMPSRVLTLTANNMLEGAMTAEPSFEYLGFNKIRLFNYSDERIITIRAACEHLANGESIALSYYGSFIQLALLDMKVYLFNQLRYFDNIGSAFGQIQLKTDQWQGASDERENLLKEWRETFHLDLGIESFM